MRIDLYLWLTYRLGRLRPATVIPWERLQQQFAYQLADTRDGRKQFRRDFQGHLRKVLAHYPEAKAEPSEGRSWPRVARPSIGQSAAASRPGPDPAEGPVCGPARAGARPRAATDRRGRAPSGRCCRPTAPAAAVGLGRNLGGSCWP
jgi:hypothetical protein